VTEGSDFMTRQFAMWFGIALLAGLAGCDRPGTAPTVKVTGAVTYNGAPIEGVSVGFIPDKGRPASGLTDDEGRFTLSTFRTGDGAVPGKHSVSVTEGPPDTPPPMPGTPEAKMWRPPPPRFPRRYSDPRTSGFTADTAWIR